MMAFTMRILAIALLMGAGTIGVSRADTTLGGSVRMVSATDVPAIGASLGCRVWTVSSAITTINANTPTCMNQRCIRTFGTSPLYGGAGFGGFPCNHESTGVYGPPPAEPSDMVYYELIDAEVNAGTCDHIGFYAVQGQLANNNLPNNPGDPRAAACAGTVTINCFTAADPSNADPTPITGTVPTWGSMPHQIRSLGGLSPVPTVRVSGPGSGGCGAGQVRVSWDDPISADPLMKNGVASPLQGVNLYRNDAPCSVCPTENDAGWVRASTPLAPAGEYGASAGPTGDCVDIGPSGAVSFALTIRVKGPGQGPTTQETYLSARSQCVSATGTAARIVFLTARYAGRGVVRVGWTTGFEGGVDGLAVSRATSPEGPFTRISDVLAATGDGASYVFDDRVRASLGKRLFYQIEIVGQDGTIERSGTTSVTTPGPKMKPIGPR